jgi:hypothetical protein
MGNRLFPGLPEDLSATSDADIATLLSDHEAAIEKINADDEEFLKGLSADEIIAQLREGVEQVKALRAENSARVEAHENYLAEKAKLTAELTAEAEDDEDTDEDEDEVTEGAEAVVAEAEAITEETAEERELVRASVTTSNNPVTTLTTTTENPVSVRFARTPPAPAPERIVVNTPEPGTALVAAGEMALSYPDPLDEMLLANLVKDAALHHGPHPKIDPPGKYRFGGPEHKIARAEFSFPEERTLGSDVDANLEKIRQVGNPFFGKTGQEALVASGGLCAPLTPIYSMPNFATEAEPVWDSLPVFRAVRGGVNVPTATYIGDITEAISSISEADDALGGTFATKSCQDLDCPDYTETAVQILAHCREYGNLNARAWPEKIAHENALTMAALARTSEGFMLDRIKALSVNVTNGVETLGALIYLVDGIVKSAFGIRSRLRMPANTRFRALLPAVTMDILLLDTIQTQFDRFRSREELVEYLRRVGIDPVFYLDTPSTGTSQIADAAQTAAALDGLPDNIQWAIYPEGAFLGIDMGVLELGIVRDSTLNSTNDFQVFGERFRNVARLAPEQAAYWVTTDLCASGQFPPAGTVRTCD